jgi:hypothetical protein
MGCSASSPLVAAIGGARRTDHGGATLAYFDPGTLKELGFQHDGPANTFGIGIFNEPVRIRASADGKVVTAWQSPHAIGSECHIIGRGRITRYWDHGGPKSLVPSADGRMLYAPGQIYAPNYRKIVDSNRQPHEGPWFVPAVQGDYCLSVRRADEAPFAERANTPVVDVLRSGTAVLSLGEISTVTIPEGLWGHSEELQRSLVLVPDASLLVVIPSNGRDKVRLHRLDVKSIAK